LPAAARGLRTTAMEGECDTPHEHELLEERAAAEKHHTPANVQRVSTILARYPTLCMQARAISLRAPLTKKLPCACSTRLLAGPMYFRRLTMGLLWRRVVRAAKRRPAHHHPHRWCSAVPRDAPTPQPTAPRRVSLFVQGHGPPYSKGASEPSMTHYSLGSLCTVRFASLTWWWWVCSTGQPSSPSARKSTRYVGGSAT